MKSTARLAEGCFQSGDDLGPTALELAVTAARAKVYVPSRRLKRFDIPVALIGNGSLLAALGLREELLKHNKHCRPPIAGRIEPERKSADHLWHLRKGSAILSGNNGSEV